MSKFFVGCENIFQEENTIIITGDDVNHIKNVLRFGVGDEIILCDGCGFDYNAVITKIDNCITASYSDIKVCNTEPERKYILYQGIAKGERMDQLIQKSVELGVYKIVPMICKYTVVRFNNDKDKQAKVSRWQKIAVEAAKQCNRGIIPEISMPVGFNKAVDEAAESLMNGGICFIPYENERETSFRSWLTAKSLQKAGEVSFFIGSEGGFCDKEIEYAKNKELETVSLGNRILRTETAGPAVLAALEFT